LIFYDYDDNYLLESIFYLNIWDVIFDWTERSSHLRCINELKRKNFFDLVPLPDDS
jgi:hypothetical protein